MEEVFESERFYRAADPELRVFGTEGVLAVQRHRGTGPPFYRVGGKVLYRGADLNEYLASCRVETRAGA